MAGMDASITSAQYLPLSLHPLLFARGLGADRQIAGERPVDQGTSDVLPSYLFIYFPVEEYVKEKGLNMGP